MFDAIGRLALGQERQRGATTAALVAVSGSYSIAGVAVFEARKLGAASGAYSLAGSAAGGVTRLACVAATYAIAGTPASFADKIAMVPGVYNVAGQPSAYRLVFVAAGGAYGIAPGYSEIRRTGTDLDLFYGGIGHYLVAAEEARQLARITRKTPAPIVRTTKPVFRPIGSPLVPSPAAPLIDLHAAQNERAAAQQAALQAATIKRRRQEVEFLLLAS